MKKSFTFAVLAVLASLLSFPMQAQESIIGIYKGSSTSSSNRIFRYNGSILYSGSSPTSVNTKRFFCTKDKVYDGHNAGCNVAFHTNNNYFYKGKASFSSDLMFKINGNQVYYQDTNELEYSYDGRRLSDASGNVLLSTDAPGVPLMVMLAALEKQ